MEKLAPEDPQSIGAYTLLARLGAGGMGQVFLARSDRGRTAAVKLVRRELAEQETFRARFRQEVASARRVGGAWTAPVLDADTEAEVPWLATGYVAGPSLQSVVGTRRPGALGPGAGTHGPLPERSVRILASGLAHALQDIHAAGLIHRDLKPSNVMVTIDGPRVIDFGIARALESTTTTGLTLTGATVGSPGFMSPEQVRGDRLTAASDVFSLGSVLAYAATGRLAFGAADSSPHALMFRIAQEEPDTSQLPEGLGTVVRACLQKDPAARPTTRDILARVGEAEDSGAGPSGEPWLPGALLAQLGQHAVELLEYEDPTSYARRPQGLAQLAKAPALGAIEAAATPAPSPAAPAPDASPSDEVSVSAPPSPPAPGAPGASQAGPAEDDSTTVIPVQAPAPTSTPAPTPTPAPAAEFGPIAPPPPYGYGYPQAGPGAAPAYGYPQPGYGQRTPPPYGTIPPPPPYGQTQAPFPEPEPERRSTRSTVVLIAVALVVALGAGGSVYAFMGSGSSNDDKDTTVAASADPKQPEKDSPAPPASSASPSDSASPEDGDVPTRFVGSWKGGVNTPTGFSTRQLTIEQGKVGDTVLTLTADGPTEGGGSYHCVFQAPLSSAPASDAPLQIGSSTVTKGEPMSSCTPGAPTTLTILGNGDLQRVTTTGEALTYTKGN